MDETTMDETTTEDKTSILSLAVPRELPEALMKRAKELGLSRSHYCRLLFLKALEEDKTDE